MINKKKISNICLGSANFGSSYGINKKKAVKINPIKYPPVGPTKYAIPPPLAKTGSPIEPCNRYNITV